MHAINQKRIRDMAVFAMLGAIMLVSKKLMEWLPNIHLLSMFIVTFTVVYRKRALIPIYIYIFLEGIMAGFATWWIPYLYVWTVLWGMTMLLPKNISKKVAVPLYMVICALHGFLFGILYAPSQALFFGLTFQGMLAWIAAGFPFDIAHGISNFVVGALVMPLVAILKPFDDPNNFKNQKGS